VSARVPVSVVINTLNEQNNLPFALRSVAWADEVVVCDMHSDDSTQEIARQHGARVVLHERVGFVEPARAFAIGQAKNNWVLVLDADELISRPLSEVIAQRLASDSADVFRVPRLNYLLGAPLRYLGWGPDQDAQLRLFKKSAVRVTADIHKSFHVNAGAREERILFGDGCAIVHFNYIDLTHFIDKLNRYASVEARQAHARGERSSFGRALASAAKEWFSRYLRAGGAREGWRGFYLTAMMSMYRLAIQGKLTELETGNDESTVSKRYRDEAERYLAAYKKGTGV